MNAARIGRSGCLGLAFALQSACGSVAGDSADGPDSAAEDTASDETMEAGTGESDGGSQGDDHTSTTPGDASESTGEDELPCIDPHFVVFLAPDGISYVDVPADLEVTRIFADSTQEAADCHLAAHGECLLECVASDVEVVVVSLTWTCADGTLVAIYREMAPPFMVEVDVAASETAAGCV